MSSGEAVRGSRIVLAAFVLEGALAAIYFFWIELRGLRADLLPTLNDVKGGLSFAALLLGFNYLLYGPLARGREMLRGIFEFNDHVVAPFARSLGTTEALLLSFFAGFGEELFFRGVLQVELGILASSALFAILHFGTKIRSFPLVSFLYFGISLGIGLVYSATGSLPLVIIAHAAYDFALLLVLKRRPLVRAGAVSESP